LIELRQQNVQNFPNIMTICNYIDLFSDTCEACQYICTVQVISQYCKLQQ